MNSQERRPGEGPEAANQLHNNAILTAHDRVTDALQRHGCTGRDATWRCPAHVDRAPFLSVTGGQDRVWLHCYAGCDTEDILVALGLTTADLFSHGGDAA